MPRPLSSALEERTVDWRRLHTWPVDWSTVFGREAALALEIGFGNGQFLADWAGAHPERDHLGLELSWTAATHLFRRLDAARVTNARALLIDAEVALRNLFVTDSLDEVFVNHPCPWPKARHHRRRLLRPEVLALLADRMRPGARLTVVTDHAEYASWLADVLVAQDALESEHPTVEVDRLPGRRPTKYERKAMAQGTPIHYFEWRKVRSPPGAESGVRAPTEGSATMPSLTLRGPHDPSRLFAGKPPQAFQEKHDGVRVVVRLGGAYRHVDQALWLVETLVKEDELQQQFGILVVQRKDGELLVKLSDLGRPHPTHGVKRAVFCVARWLMEGQTGLEIAHDSLGAAARGEPEAPEGPS